MDISAEERLVALLREKKLTITTAESLTGGLIAGTIINVAGASWVINEAHVTYSNEAKMRLLNVKAETISRYGVVSEEVAKEMALGAAKLADADLAISVTGVAGPDGGTHDKPVGTVYAGFYVMGGVYAVRYNFDGDRTEVRLKTVRETLGKMYEYIEKLQ